MGEEREEEEWSKNGRTKMLEENDDDENDDEKNDENDGNRANRGETGGSKGRWRGASGGFGDSNGKHKSKSQLDALNCEKKQNKKTRISESKAGNKYHRQIAEEGRKKEEEERKKEEMRRTNKIRADHFKEKLLSNVLERAARKKLNAGGIQDSVAPCQTCGSKNRPR